MQSCKYMPIVHNGLNWGERGVEVGNQDHLNRRGLKYSCMVDAGVIGILLAHP